VQGGRNPDGVDKRLQEIVENHRPTGQEPKVRIQSSAHVRVSRAGHRIDRRHASIAEGRDHHSEHGDEDDGYEVAVGELLRHPV
jgi:hypothetical protein